MAARARTRHRAEGAEKKAAAPAAAGAAEAPVWQLKITLLDVDRPIWRRIQVPGAITLARLHLVVQAAMGWENSHLYSFSAGGTEYGEPMPELRMGSARTARLDSTVRGPHAKLRYTYDFGDSWEHEVLVEKAVPPEAGVRYPLCVAGERACPPEDCGGVWGYEELLEILRDPRHEEYEERLEWLGGSFDPAAFDLKATNAALRRMR